jgi:glycosyltransferase involved in cell wall biosynthesis
VLENIFFANLQKDFLCGPITRSMKICLVTAFPPSHERLNEYGYHLALELQRNPFLSVTVLANEHDGPAEEFAGFDVERCWRPNSLGNPARLLQKIREINPHVVWFNLVFASFGVNPMAAFFGLCTPALVRVAGYSTHVTLHQLIDHTCLEDSGVRFPRLYSGCGWLATHLLLRANSVTVLLPAYRRTLLEKYHSRNVHLRAHGIFSARPQYPDFSQRGNPPRILAFGKWGTYKRVEPLLAAFPEIKKAVPEAKLVIAGESHPLTPGYVEALRARYEGDRDIEVHGYVPEEELGKLFSRASLVVMPYSSATGSSGVAHQACQFGLPIVCSDLPDFRDMAEEEGLAIEFFRAGDQKSLTTAVIGVLRNLERQRDMAEQNYAAAVRLTMPQIVRKYLRSFEWQLRGREKATWRLRARRSVPFLPVLSSAWNSTLLPGRAPATSVMQRAAKLGPGGVAESASTAAAPAASRPTIEDPAGSKAA